MSTAAAGMPRPNMLTAALGYAARGWKVFPLAAKSKVPLIAGGNGYLDATTDAEQIRKWWAKAPHANIGLGTGHEFWVLDIDPDGMAWLKANDLESTYEVKTGRGGRHLFYAMPAGVVIGDSIGKIAPGVDIKSAGGYVVAAPSETVICVSCGKTIDKHPEGCKKAGTRPGHYQWIDCDGIAPEGPFSEAPPWLVDMAAKTGETAGKKFTLPDVIAEGGRNDTLYKLAASMRSYSFEYPEIRSALDGANARCVPPLPSAELDQIAQSACSKPAGKSARFKPQPPDPTDADVPGDVRRPVLVPPAGPRPGTEPDPEAGNNAAPPPEPDAPQRARHESGGFMHNDTGNANRLVAAYGKELIWCEERQSFAYWTGTRWKLDKKLTPMKWARRVLLKAHAEAEGIEDDAKRRVFLKFLSTSLNRQGIANMVEMSKLSLRCVGAAEFDRDPYLLNFNNGTLDLRTGKLRPSRREDLISKQIPYAFNAAAKCPRFHKFLRRIMGDHDAATPEQRERAERLIGYLQRLFGSACNGIPAKILAMLWGSGDNGKSTLIEIIRAALGGGEYAGQLQIETLMATAKEAIGSNAIGADLAGLQGCRFVTASEPEKGSRFATARIKNILGLTEIKARFLKENPFTFPPSHKIFVDCNDRPIITNPDDAIFNRVKLIPFTVTIPKNEIDPTLAEKLREELPGIMAWLAIGAAEYLKNGLGEIPEVSAALEEYRSESDPLSAFYKSECILLPNAWVAKTDLWLRYQQWAVNEKVKFPLKKDMFEERIEHDGCSETRREHGTIRAWRGIALQKQATPEG